MSSKNEGKEAEREERESKKQRSRNKRRSRWGENKILRLRETGSERIRQERERSKTNSEAAETRRGTLNEGEGNPVVEK